MTNTVNVPRAYLLNIKHLIEMGNFDTGVCCCGSYANSHGIGDGHSPVDEGSYYAMQMARDTETLLAAESDMSDHVDAERAQAAYNAVIDYMLGKGRDNEPMTFLRCWNEGDFDSLRNEWPEAPIEIYYADPLADYDAVDAEVKNNA